MKWISWIFVTIVNQINAYNRGRLRRQKRPPVSCVVFGGDKEHGAGTWGQEGTCGQGEKGGRGEQNEQGYIVIPATAGTIVPDLPEGVEVVKIGDQTYVQFGETYYQPIQVDGKNMYEIAEVRPAE